MTLRAHLLLACASTVAGRIFLFESTLTQSPSLPAPAPLARRLNQCTACGPDTADNGAGRCDITCDASRRLSERSTVTHDRLSSYLARSRSVELNSHLDALWGRWGSAVATSRRQQSVRRGLQLELSSCQGARVAARCSPSPPPPSPPPRSPPFACLSCGTTTAENAEQCEVPCGAGRRLTEEAQTVDMIAERVAAERLAARPEAMVHFPHDADAVVRPSRASLAAIRPLFLPASET